jgi:hypothetical protein
MTVGVKEVSRNPDRVLEGSGEPHAPCRKCVMTAREVVNREGDIDRPVKPLRKHNSVLGGREKAEPYMPRRVQRSVGIHRKRP